MTSKFDSVVAIVETELPAYARKLAPRLVELALTELRTPDESMVKAGCQARYVGVGLGGVTVGSWQAMIDTVLSE